MSATDFERVLGLHGAVNQVVGEFEPRYCWSLQCLGAKALLEARLEGLTGDGKWKRSAHDSVAQAFELLSAAPFFSIGLHSGVTGIGWVARLLNRRLGPADQFDVSDVDEMVLGYLSSPEAWDGDFDFLAGATGCAVYAFEHPDRRHRLEMLEAYLRLLSCRAEPDEGGVWWKTPASVLKERQLNFQPSDGFDMGIAHGVPGVVAMFSRLTAAGVDFIDLPRLLNGSVAACLSELRIDPRSDREVIGYFRGDGATARCAWCYGEPGVAVALGAAGKALGDRRLRDKARTLFRSSVSRSDRSTLQVDDICLCHGWTGLSLVSRYLQSLVPGESPGPCPIEAQFLPEMRAACDASLACGELPLFGPTRSERPRRDPTFLTGALGVAHALLDVAFPESRGADLPWADCVLM